MMGEAVGNSAFPSLFAASLTRSEVERAQEVKSRQHAHMHTGEMSALALSEHLPPTIFNCKIFP